jgi:hypothetical protein
MKNKLPLSPADKFTIAGLVVAASGVIIQIISGAKYPAIPPVFFILLIPAILIAFGRWRWTPFVAIVGGIFLTLGFFSSGASIRIFDLNKPGVAAGLWIQMLAVGVATIAGIIAVIRNYRIENNEIVKNEKRG